MTKKTVSERAVFHRLNRALAREGQILRQCRGDSPGYRELGNYYCVDLNTNFVCAKHVPLEAWARDFSVLRENEVITD